MGGDLKCSVKTDVEVAQQSDAERLGRGGDVQPAGALPPAGGGPLGQLPVLRVIPKSS